MLVVSSKVEVTQNKEAFFAFYGYTPAQSAHSYLFTASVKNAKAKKAVESSYRTQQNPDRVQSTLDTIYTNGFSFFNFYVLIMPNSQTVAFCFTYN